MKLTIISAFYEIGDIMRIENKQDRLKSWNLLLDRLIEIPYMNEVEEDE